MNHKTSTDSEVEREAFNTIKAIAHYKGWIRNWNPFKGTYYKLETENYSSRNKIILTKYKIMFFTKYYDSNGNHIWIKDLEVMSCNITLFNLINDHITETEKTKTHQELIDLNKRFLLYLREFTKGIR